MAYSILIERLADICPWRLQGIVPALLRSSSPALHPLEHPVLDPEIMDPILVFLSG